MKAKYLELAGELEKLIPQLLSEGITKLPCEDELSRRYGCSRQTTRAALAHLLEKQLIIKRKGSGTYISTTASKGRVALILPHSGEYVFPAMLSFAKQFFEDVSLELICLSSENSIMRERELLRGLLRHPPAGLILYPAGSGQSCVNADLLQELCASGVPVVSLCNVNALPSCVISICADTAEGTREAALRMLRSKNNRLKAVLPVSSPRSTAQYNGLMRSAVESGGDFSESDILWLRDGEMAQLQNNSYQHLRDVILPAVQKGCSVFCGNDEIAYHIIRILSRSGLKIPDDVSVCGFDNSYICTSRSSSISSVGTAPDEVIKAACRAMLMLITGRSAENALIPMSFFKRRSTVNDD